MKVLVQLDMTSQRIINLADPSAATDATTKGYVDNLVNGLAFKDEVMAATTGNLTLATGFANGQVIDGYTLVTGDRVLAKNQTTQTENGIYIVPASGAPTRAADFDAGVEWRQATVKVVSGTVNGNTQWTCTNTGTLTFGSTNITFAASGGGVTYTAGNGLTGTTTFSVLANGTSLDVSASGVKIAPAAAGAGLVESAGVLAVGAGTGITVNADDVAIDTSVVTRKYAVSVGNGALTSIAVTHNLGTKDVQVQCRQTADDAFVLIDWVATDVNTVTLAFAVAPASNAIRCVVQG